MRLFFAVTLADNIKSIISGEVSAFPVSDFPWRWIPPENYHLTLKFLGEVREETLPALRETAVGIASSRAPFGISLGTFGAFPSLSRPRVIFYDVERGKDGLAALAGDLEKGLAALGFEREPRPLKMHLTLARVKRPLPAEVKQALLSVRSLPSGTEQLVGEFVLMRSRLRRSGAVYEELDAFKLTAPL